MKKILVLVSILVITLLVPTATPAMANVVGPNVIDTTWQKTTNGPVESTFGSTAYGCDDPFWQWTSDVWDGPNPNPDGIQIPDYTADFWAMWQNKAPQPWVETTHEWFKTTLTLPCTAQLTQDIKLISKGEDSDMLTINDSLYVYVNGQYAASGGTAKDPWVYSQLPPGTILPSDFVAATPSYTNSPYWEPASDTGWYIDGGLTLPQSLFHPGDNEICILVEEMDIWGGLGHLVFANVQYELPDVVWITPQEGSEIIIKYGCGANVPIKFQLKTQSGTLINAMQNIYLTVTGPSFSRTWQSGKGFGKLMFCKGTYMASICQDKKRSLKDGQYTAAVYDGCSDILLGTITFTISSEFQNGCFHKRHGFIHWGKDNFHIFFKGKHNCR